jgi:hypothetical protein
MKFGSWFFLQTNQRMTEKGDKINSPAFGFSSNYIKKSITFAILRKSRGKFMGKLFSSLFLSTFVDVKTEL